MASIDASRTHIISRREALGAGTYLLAFVARPAWAQDTGRYSGFARLFDDARRVLDLTVEFGLSPDTEKRLMEYLSRDYNFRTTALRVAGETNVFSNADSATSYVRAIPGILPKDFPFKFDTPAQESQIEVIRTLSEYKLPIVPPPNLVTSQSVPSLEPGKVTANEDIYVLTDIILETLGLSLSKDDLILVLINSDPDIKRQLDDLLAKVTSKQWKDVLPIIDGVFKSLTAKKIWTKLAEVLARKLGLRLGLELVPVVGWAYLCALFLISVKKNYHRFSFA
jgi:hypothetical protein